MIRTLFGPVPTDPATLTAVKAAGFSHGTVGAFDLGTGDLDKWLDARVRPWLDAGFRLVATGDDLCRTPAALAAALANPDRVRRAVARLAGVCDAIEMCDEASMCWRTGPTDGHRQLVALMRSVPGCPPIAWSVGVGQNSRNPTGELFRPVLAAWGAADLSDYSSVYTPPQVWGLPDLPGGQYSAAAVWAALSKGLALAPRGRRLSTLIPFAGDFVANGVVQQAAWRPEAVLAAITAAVYHGVEVLRFYSYDLTEWRTGRAKGAAVQSTGTSHTVGPDRWAAATLANGLLATLGM